MTLENILKVLTFEMEEPLYNNIDKYSQNGPIQSWCKYVDQQLQVVSNDGKNLTYIT